jgi:hypothetical protein
MNTVQTLTLINGPPDPKHQRPANRPGGPPMFMQLK